MVFLNDTSIQSVVANMGIRSKACQRHLHAVVLHVVRPAPIVRLLRFCGPSAVTRFVVSSVVDSVNRVTNRWSRTNVLQESRERLTPCITHRNSTASVVAIGGITWIVTALFHALPCVPLVGLVPPSCGSVFSVSVASDVNPEASTTTAVAYSDVTRIAVNDGSTIALAAPNRPLPLSWRAPKNDPSAKTLSGNVNELSHTNMIPQSGRNWEKR